MIRFRVDDYPGTKPAEFGKHNLENFKRFHELMTRYGAKYVLGVIPAHTSDEALRWMGQQENLEVALHGVNHDERFPNEFREHLTAREVYHILRNEKGIFEEETGKPVNIYIPPHNVVDSRTCNALVLAGFKELFTGPETDPAVISHAIDVGLQVVRHSPPYLYGRSDELMARGAPLFYRQAGFTNLGLHWTWEWNIGLENLERLLEEIKDLI